MRDIFPSDLSNDGRRRYITGFDGLRVLALLGVIFYHLLPFKVVGGYLGVPIFFAISGYLITDIFTQSYDVKHSFALKAYYLKRIKRLYPTLIVVLVASTAYITMFAYQLIEHIRSIIVTNLTFTYNWWLIGHGQSYFDRYNGESPFTHLWYLSTLMQYYLIWPIVLFILIKIFKNKRIRVAGCLALLAVVSAIIMAVLYDPANVNRVYYGTETRIAPFLLGSALACVWPSTKIVQHNFRSDVKNAINFTGLVIFLIMVAMMFRIPGTTGMPYYGGMFIFTVFAVLMIGIIAHPAFAWNRLLSNPLFRYLGSRSYGIYMYQLPIMIFYEQKVVNIAKHPVLNVIIPLVIIMVVSELSYRFIEKPLAKLSFSEMWTRVKEAFDVRKGWSMKQLWTGIILFVLLIAVFGALHAPDKLHNHNSQLQTKIAKNKKETNKNNAEALKKQRSKKKTEIAKKDVVLNGDEKATAARYHLTNQEVKSAENIPLTGVGDSVLEDTGKNLQDVFKTAYMSAKVGRQVTAAPDILSKLKKDGNLSDNILINLGTNGPMGMADVEKIEQVVGPKRHIFWVNVHVPTRGWESSVNRNLELAEDKYKNITVIDWHGPSQNQEAWFYEDHVHPNPTGSVEYASIVTKKIIETLKK